MTALRPPSTFLKSRIVKSSEWKRRKVRYTASGTQDGWTIRHSSLSVPFASTACRDCLAHMNPAGDSQSGSSLVKIRHMPITRRGLRKMHSNMTVKIDWDNPPIEREANKQFLEEAVRQGHGYVVIIEGYDPPDHDIRFVAPNDQVAIECAHTFAYSLIRHVDKLDSEISPHCPTRPYKLYHRDSGRLVKDYTPPTLEELATGKVKMFWY